jgi:hypothetical protein
LNNFSRMSSEETSSLFYSTKTSLWDGEAECLI